MGNNQKLIIGGILIVIVALLAGTFLLTGNKKASNTTAVRTKTIPTPTPLQGETIMATFTRFVPATLTIKKGTVLNFGNFSGNDIDVESDDNKQLSIGVLKDNDTSDFVKLSPGTYTYFNKLKPEEKGTVIVTDK